MMKNENSCFVMKSILKSYMEGNKCSVILVLTYIPTHKHTYRNQNLYI